MGIPLQTVFASWLLAHSVSGVNSRPGSTQEGEVSVQTESSPIS